MIYANGDRRLSLSTIAIMQYIAPTIVFLVTIFLFHEEFDMKKLTAFAMIWAAVILYAISIFASARKKKH